MLTAMLVGIMLGAGETAASDGWIDLSKGWRFQPDPRGQGAEAGWQSAAFDDGAWPEIDAGKPWEAQGFPAVDGYAWYRKRVDAPADWKDKSVWLVFGGVNDACTLYCNGERVNAFGDEKTNSVAMTPIVAEVGRYLRFGEPNTIAVACLDWGNNGGPWLLPCALTTDASRLPLDSVLSYAVEYETKCLRIDLELLGLGNDHTGASAWAEVAPKTAAAASAQTAFAAIPDDAARVVLSLALPDARGGDVYCVRAGVRGADGELLAGVSAEREFVWPEEFRWPAPYQDLEVRNNFVTELFSVDVASGEEATYAFLNPRDGWVFFSVSGAEAPRAWLDDESDALAFRRNPDTGAFEAMRKLKEDRHSLRVTNAAGGRIDLRTMPEIAYCYYPAAPHLAPFGPYDWDFVSRYVLPHVNTIITAGPAQAEFEQWRREGRQWLANASLPGLGSRDALTTEQVYDVWAANPGVAAPGYGGIMVDEFLGDGSENYRAWSEAMRRLHETPAFAGKTFYAWCGDLFEVPISLEFSKTVMSLDYRFSWEKYLAEEPDADAAQQSMYRALVYPLDRWRTLMPGVERHVVMCLGYLCAPPESLNLNPAVNYNVLMDMQYRLLATHPSFAGLFGVMQYSASYADEESLRWAHRMFRHYCIEGNRTPLIADPYLLPHLDNPDFAEELDGWDVQPAETDSIGIGRMEGFSFLQGRYPQTPAGDRFCRMTRSAAGPNRISQQLRALEPGRIYSLKLIAADTERLHEKQTLGLSPEIRGAEKIEALSFQFAYPSCYSHEVGPYTREKPAYFTFYHVVFRAPSGRANLVISDWANATRPGGPIGQAIGSNFAEVQPFLEP